MKKLEDLNLNYVLDIGANVGEFSKKILSMNSSCKCFMVEANPLCEPLLRKTGIPYDIALLSDRRTFKNFYIQDDNPVGTGASVYKENTKYYSYGKRLCLTTSRLDDHNYFKHPIDLVKLDVQGSEIDIIKGGLNTILNCKYILIETSLAQYNQGAPLIGDIFSLMSDLNFYTNTIIELRQNKEMYNDCIFQVDFLFENLNKKINN